MDHRLRSRVASGLDRARLLGPIERLREAWLVRKARGGPNRGPDDLPLPPAHLRLLVDGSSGDAARFLDLGTDFAAAIRTAVAEAGGEIESMEAILDFGCGCGRVARNWAGLGAPAIHGCDYNPDLVGWCADNLPFVEALRNELEPPTPYEAESFDLVYALSVLTHLTEPLQEAWIAEFRRLLKPGGLLIVSVLGDGCRHRLTRSERARYDRGELVVERDRLAGSNLCTAYHPAQYVTDHLLSGFEAVGAFNIGQEAYVARRLPASA